MNKLAGLFKLTITIPFLLLYVRQIKLPEETCSLLDKKVKELVAQVVFLSLCSVTEHGLKTA